MLNSLEQWDRELLLFFNGLSQEAYDPFWLVVTKPESWVLLYVLIFYLIFARFGRTTGAIAAVFAILTALLSNLSSELIKRLTTRLRPNNDASLNELLRILLDAEGYSFFSGHAATSFAVSTLVVLLFRIQLPWIYAILIWPFLFSLSRLYLAVHYPSDVLVGMLAGITMGVIAYRLFNKFFGGSREMESLHPTNS
ncbi:phosphatase PAP2 family protein [Aureitalea marina]|uniref:Phosphatidic acid phosphatase type 2/haloperoxidase domain-containing protein n=1 Tax=Aureitalea marina TaxID=930804 RepID=A0A2S7KM92_9FLAO|nr:phosphatase PAP2 family protein [Aureitalea marina]PQB03747.1 hypothetical protein BST85_01635 [Aureitalea marina]